MKRLKKKKSETIQEDVESSDIDSLIDKMLVNLFRKNEIQETIPQPVITNIMLNFSKIERLVYNHSICSTTELIKRCTNIFIDNHKLNINSSNLFSIIISFSCIIIVPNGFC